MKIKKLKSDGLHIIFTRENKEAGWVVSEVAVEEKRSDTAVASHLIFYLISLPNFRSYIYPHVYINVVFLKSFSGYSAACSFDVTIY